ncbi:enoyl-CoA hydratase/isomerase family protein [Microbulbifer aestuariivivens]|uniref:enoyl-CoA hydratase/isomerase family protein n=1 Tax=Microbulbifer aestuariivivens TaxID=1908308 RepID=UPI0031E7D9A8
MKSTLDAATATGAICLDREGALARITIDNPAQRNAMTVGMWESMLGLLDEVEADSEIRAVLLTGAGNKAFCAGASIKELASAMSNPAEMRRQNILIRDVQLKLQRLSRPTIAVIRGACYGGGCGLALACDIRLADTAATFAITPAKLGILYSLPDTQRLIDQVGMANAKDMLLTGLPVTAERAQQIGLVQHLAGESELAQKEGDLVRSLLSNSQYSLRWTKASMEYLSNAGSLSAQERENSEQELQQAFDGAFDGSDFREGCAAFLARRKADFRWPNEGDES